MVTYSDAEYRSQNTLPSTLVSSPVVTADHRSLEGTATSSQPEQNVIKYLQPSGKDTSEPHAFGTPSTDAARAALMVHLAHKGNEYLSPLSQRAVDITSAHDSVARQREQVEDSTVKLSRETDKLSKEAEKARDLLKELGDVDNWAQMLDRDISILEETLRIVEEDGEEEFREGDIHDVNRDGGEVGLKKGKKGKANEHWLWSLFSGSRS